MHQHRALGSRFRGLTRQCLGEGRVDREITDGFLYMSFFCDTQRSFLSFLSELRSRAYVAYLTMKTLCDGFLMEKVA